MQEGVQKQSEIAQSVLERLKAVPQLVLGRITSADKISVAKTYLSQVVCKIKNPKTKKSHTRQKNR